MKILFVSTEFEEKARGITGIIRSMERAAKKDGHEVGILAGYPDGRFNKSELLDTKVEHLYLQHYLKDGRHSIFPDGNGLRGKKAQLKILLGGAYLKPYEFRVNHSLISQKLSAAHDLDYVIKVPYIYQFINHGAEGVAKRVIKRIVKQYKVDLVITGAPMNLTRKDVAPAKLAQFVHDVMPIEMLETPADNDTPRRFARQLYSAATGSDLVYVNSNDTYRKVLEINENAHAKIVYGTASNIPTDIEDSAILQTLGIKPDNYLFYVSSLEKRKNIDGILDAYALIHKKINMPMIFAGGRGYGFEDIKKHHLSLPPAIQKDVIFLNYISEEDKYTLFRNARTFVFPSFGEGIGLQIIEALSTALPVVTTRKGALIEAGGDAVYYIDDPYNVHEIANAILTVSTDEKVRTKLRSHMKKQVAKFVPENFAQRFIEGLHDLQKS